MPNLGALRTSLRGSVGNPLASDIPDTLLTAKLNDAYEHIATRYKFHKTRKICILTTVSGSYKYNLPSDVTVVKRIKDLTNHKKLTLIDDSNSSMYEGRDNLQGRPEKYIRYRGFIEITPTPDDAYRLEVYYVAAVTPLADDTDTPVIPLSWHHGIRLLAKHLYFDDKGDTARAMLAYDSYKTWLEDQPVEVDEEKRSLDQGIALPGLQRRHRGLPRDWDEDE